MRKPSLPFITFSVAVALVLTGCSATTEADAPSSKPTAEASETAQPTPAASEETDYADALAERDAFLEAQQLPLDGSPLVATTDAQKQFIAEQRAFMEQNGAAFDAQSESLALALAADGCETAILNGHEMDADLLQMHVVTSPLFKQLIPADAADEQRFGYERNLVSTIVFGASFMCPADAPQWESAFTEVYGG